MKRLFLALLILLAPSSLLRAFPGVQCSAPDSTGTLSGLQVHAADSTGAHSGLHSADSTGAFRVGPVSPEAEKAVRSTQGFRQGISIVPLPIISYNTDLGLQYGAYVDLFDYGTQPSLFPNFYHHLHVEGSHYTKGQTFIHSEYDSSFLIPGVRFTASLSWQRDPLYQFYGFNGSVTAYDPSIDRRDGIAYYSYKRSLLRFISTFQGRIYGPLGWLAGLNFRYYKSENLDFKGYDPANTLFRNYLDNGIIKEDELGGMLADLTAGLRFDTRDFEPDPMDGIWAELFLNGSPDFFRTGYPYLKVALRWRQYITPGPEWLTLAYHIAWQSTVLGRAPFYIQQNLCTVQVRQATTEGLGGINTLRGVMASRLIGDGYAWSNFEVRLRLLQWDFLKMSWTFAVNPFYDLGCITKPFRLEEMAAAYGRSAAELRRETVRLHHSAGVGIKVGMNSNSIFSLEWAKPFNSQDGRSSIYFAINYVF